MMRHNRASTAVRSEERLKAVTIEGGRCVTREQPVSIYSSFMNINSSIHERRWGGGGEAKSRACASSPANQLAQTQNPQKVDKARVQGSLRNNQSDASRDDCSTSFRLVTGDEV